jgi:hypothetical protein
MVVGVAASEIVGMSENTFPFPAKGTEKRRAGRLPCMEAKCQFGPLADLSRSGAKVLARKPITIPENTSVNLRIECNDACIMVPARPTSSRKRRDGMYDVGFEFLNVSEQMGRALVQLMRTAAVTHEYKPRKIA